MKSIEVFELNPIVDDPRYEGFALTEAPSVLGRASLDDDLTPGFGSAEENPSWSQPRIAAFWKAPKVVGRVSEFNDYPCVDMVLPVFSERAVERLRPMLADNGELLPLDSTTKTKYFLYNILTISDALDRSRSVCDFWCNPPTTATEVQHFEFRREIVTELSIFRIREMPMSVFVTSRFVDKVDFYGLAGFHFTKVWPLARGENWRMQVLVDDGNRKALRQETLVVVLPLDGSEKQLSQIAALEGEVDRRLQVTELQQEYLGSYEGHDIVDSDYRMFFSAPSAKALLGPVSELVGSYTWPKQVTVYCRQGRIYDASALQEAVLI